MFLSMLEIDPRYTPAAMALSDPGYMHKMIQEAFDTKRNEYNVLYRVLDYAERKILYVQSKAVPNWMSLTRKGFNLIEVKNIQGLENTFKEENCYRFAIKAFPSKKSSNVREPLIDRESRMQWLQRESQKAGFDVVEVQEREQVRKTIHRITGPFKLGGVVYEGVLKIKDKDAFVRAYQNGIGPEKAYGYGLLMLFGRA